MGQNTATIARTVYEAFNDRDFERGLAVIAEDAEWVNMPTDDRFRGPEGFRRDLEQWANAFPDGRIEITNVRTSDDWAVVEFTGRGTNTGPLATPAGEMPATGRSVELQFCDVMEIRDGKIVRGRSYFDMATMMRQLGLMPEVPAGATA
jgi:steroid delta-isomerase-like uncharacterized protein